MYTLLKTLPHRSFEVVTIEIIALKDDVRKHVTTGTMVWRSEPSPKPQLTGNNTTRNSASKVRSLSLDTFRGDMGRLGLGDISHRSLCSYRF